MEGEKVTKLWHWPPFSIILALGQNFSKGLLSLSIGFAKLAKSC
jgi:hypothetical protein